MKTDVIGLEQLNAIIGGITRYVDGKVDPPLTDEQAAKLAKLYEGQREKEERNED